MAGYLWALKDIATDQEIHESTGIDVLEFKQSITDVQDEATKQVSKACPQFVGDINNYLLKLTLSLLVPWLFFVNHVDLTSSSDDNVIWASFFY